VSQFFRLLVSNLCVDADGGPIYGTKYDMKHACKHCGSGAEPIGPRFMSKLKKDRRGVLKAGFGEMLIDLDLARKFKANGIGSIVEVYKSSGHEKWPFMEIRGEAILPQFSKKSSGYEKDAKRQCPYCKRDGFGGIPHEPMHLIFENIDPILLQKNILITYERFGYSKLREPFSDSIFARPLYIVSEKVKGVLEDAKVKGVEFVPVSISVKKATANDH